MRRIMSLCDVAVHRNGLIAKHRARTSVCRRRIYPVGIQVQIFAPGHEECADLMQNMQAAEIHVGPIHDVDGTRLRKQHIECVNIVQFAVGNGMASWNKLLRRSSSVCIFTAALVERKSAHGKSDRHRSMVVEHERIDRAGQIHIQIIIGIQPPGLRDQPLGKLGADPPIAGLVGISQCGTANRLSQTHMIFWPIALTDTPRCRASSPDR